MDNFHVCMIRNISSRATRDELNSYFNEKTKNLDGFQGFSVRQNKRRGEYQRSQCRITFATEAQAYKASEFFNQESINNMPLKAKYLPPRSTLDRSADSQGEQNGRQGQGKPRRAPRGQPRRQRPGSKRRVNNKQQTETENSNESGNLDESRRERPVREATKYRAILFINQAGLLKNALLEKRDTLTDKDSRTSIRLDRERRTNELRVNIQSNDKQLFNKALNEINSWEVFVEKIQVDKDRFSELRRVSRDLVKDIKEKDKELFVDFNRRNNEINIIALRQNSFNEIRKLIENYKPIINEQHQNGN